MRPAGVDFVGCPAGFAKEPRIRFSRCIRQTSARHPDEPRGLRLWHDAPPGRLAFVAVLRSVDAHDRNIRRRREAGRRELDAQRGRVILGPKMRRTSASKKRH
jgi:hypothetical protein